MKRILPLSGLLLMVFCASVLAGGPEDQYVKIFNLIQQADALKDSGEGKAALDRYLAAQDQLKNFKATNPDWQTRIVDFRLEYLGKKITPLQAEFPAVPPPVTEAGMAPKINGLEDQIRLLNEQLIRSRTERAKLEALLKELLAAKPNDVDPGSMEQARQTIATLQKQLDVQKSAMDMQTQKLADLVDMQNSGGGSSAAQSRLAKQLQDERVRNEQLSRDNRKMEAVLTSPTAEVSAGLKELSKAVEELKKAKQEADAKQAKLESKNSELEKKYKEALNQLFEKKKEQFR